MPHALRKGELRYTYGEPPTRYRFTGQPEEASLGLYDYNARWYDPRLGRFIQADTIIPNVYNSIDWDRYVYARNNPIRYNDPSGHCPVCIAIGLGIAVVVWLANPETVYAPSPGHTPPTGVDPSYGDKAYFDAAPGTGDISDIYAAVTGRTLFTGEEISTRDRIIAGAISLAPVVTGGSLRGILKTFDIVKYGETATGFIKHHGVMDAWLDANIPNYVSRNPNAPTILLTLAQHERANAVFRQWKFDRLGTHFGKIDWTNVTPQEIQALSDEMFAAAGVPKEVTAQYYRQLNKYFYEELQ